MNRTPRPSDSLEQRNDELQAENDKLKELLLELRSQGFMETFDEWQDKIDLALKG